MMPKIVVMYVIAISGGTFYLSRFPERFFPGIILSYILCVYMSCENNIMCMYVLFSRCFVCKLCFVCKISQCCFVCKHNSQVYPLICRTIKLLGL